MEILQGAISAVIYQNYENGYAVLRLSVGGGQVVTVVGTIPLPAVGERLMVTGKWSNHASYGRQFRGGIPGAAHAPNQYGDPELPLQPGH